MNYGKKNSTARVVIFGSIIIVCILVLGTIWTGRSAKEGTDKAVRTVSLLYLNELAGRREQVVENNLQHRITDLRTAVDLMTEEDLSSIEKLQAYQARMKRLYTLEKFAFVDTRGQIYTALGMQDNIQDYSFDYQTLSEVVSSSL